MCDCAYLLATPKGYTRQNQGMPQETFQKYLYNQNKAEDLRLRSSSVDIDQLTVDLQLTTFPALSESGKLRKKYAIFDIIHIFQYFSGLFASLVSYLLYVLGFHLLNTIKTRYYLFNKSLPTFYNSQRNSILSTAMFYFFSVLTTKSLTIYIQ